jgi:hypothetical protein
MNCQEADVSALFFFIRPYQQASCKVTAAETEYSRITSETESANADEIHKSNVSNLSCPKDISSFP